MPDESASSARIRFSNDLRRIRKDRDVSLAAVHEATQAPESHLQAFEEGSLYNQSRMNRVYLRAFVRAYAEAVGLPPDLVVEKLNAALAGDYQNQLAAQYLERSSSPEESVFHTEVDTPVPPEDDSSGETATDGSEDPDMSMGQADESSASARAESDDSPTGSRSDPSLSQTSFPRSSSENDRSESEGESSIRRILALGVMALVLLSLGAWGITRYFGKGGLSSSPSSPPPPDSDAKAVERAMGLSTASDSGRAPETTTAPTPDTVTSPVLPLDDTMHVTVLATGPVRGMRVQQDDDLRRPYWIEEGEALVFPFTRRITLQNQVDSLRLFLDRYPYPSTIGDAEGRIVITRDTVKQFAETLTGPPASISVSPDTIPIEKPSSLDTSDAAL